MHMSNLSDKFLFKKFPFFHNAKKNFSLERILKIVRYPIRACVRENYRKKRCVISRLLDTLEYVFVSLQVVLRVILRMVLHLKGVLMNFIAQNFAISILAELDPFMSTFLSVQK